jgi:hypothetical protein
MRLTITNNKKELATANVLKNCADSLTTTVLILMKQSFKSGCVPPDCQTEPDLKGMINLRHRTMEKLT